MFAIAAIDLGYHSACADGIPEEDFSPLLQ